MIHSLLASRQDLRTTTAAGLRTSLCPTQILNLLYLLDVCTHQFARLVKGGNLGVDVLMHMNVNEGDWNSQSPPIQSSLVSWLTNSIVCAKSARVRPDLAELPAKVSVCWTSRWSMSVVEELSETIQIWSCTSGWKRELLSESVCLRVTEWYLYQNRGHVKWNEHFLSIRGTRMRF